jgi:hypothetical protein
MLSPEKQISMNDPWSIFAQNYGKEKVFFQSDVNGRWKKQV